MQLRRREFLGSVAVTMAGSCLSRSEAQDPPPARRIIYYNNFASHLL